MQRWQKDAIRRLKGASKAAEASIRKSTVEEATTHGEIDVCICQKQKDCVVESKIFVPM
ncbi:hypothetical protein KAR91_71495 [Candidatus Pacearchaeota archaeon]|nr:hypothetical protein [Candidatus Pacearchaeota archaeon]